jgi:hypothetical protein
MLPFVPNSPKWSRFFVPEFHISSPAMRNEHDHKLQFSKEL